MLLAFCYNQLAPKFLVLLLIDFENGADVENFSTGFEIIYLDRL